MAKSTKTTKSKAAKQSETDAAEAVVPGDAVEVAKDETSQILEDTTKDALSEAQEADTATETTPEADADTVNQDAPEDDAETATEGDDAPEPDAQAKDQANAADADPAPEPPVTATRDVVVERKGGFMPMVIGGIVAAGIGVGASDYIFPDGLPFGPKATQQIDLASEIALQAGRLDDLNAKLDAQPDVDMAAIDAAVTAIGDLQAQISAVTDSVDALDGRIQALEAGGGATSAPSVDLTAINAEIETLRAVLDTQKGELAQMIDTAQSEKQDAQDIARNTMARAAVTRILVALDSGSAFGDALEDLRANTDLAIPEALAQTADEGVPTAASLQDSFPDAARSALAAARSGDVDNSIGGFLSRQLGVRSTEPREGDDPDAILSRMEAAIAGGRIADALADMEALPDAAKAPLADWAATAELRLTAAREAEALATSLNTQ